jgi:hypothetical protein
VPESLDLEKTHQKATHVRKSPKSTSTPPSLFIQTPINPFGDFWFFFPSLLGSLDEGIEHRGIIRSDQDKAENTRPYVY